MKKTGIIMIMVLIPILGNEIIEISPGFSLQRFIMRKRQDASSQTARKPLAACRRLEQQSLACTFKGKVKVICYRSDEPMEPS